MKLLEINNHMIFSQRVAGIEQFSMLDFKDKLCGILFYCGCNFHCPYCYNAEITKRNIKTLSEEEVKDFLKSRIGKLDGIVFSGGECTLWDEKLLEDIVFTKNLGYEIKVDTNGSNPSLIQKLIEQRLVDYVALDFKCPEEKMKTFMSLSKFYYNFKQTFNILNNSKIPFETRTTVHTSIIDEDDINDILKTLEQWNYKGNHYIQFFFQPPENVKLLGKIKKPMRHFDTTKITSSIPVMYRNEIGNP